MGRSLPRATQGAKVAKSQPAVEVLSSLERTPVGVPLGFDPGGSHPWDSAYHGLHEHRRAAATRSERRSGEDNPKPEAGPP